MKIIVEGPDGSGKSTLVNELAKATGYEVKRGEGPEKHPGEIEQRAQRWNFLTFQDPRPIIFDRHPCISHPIYSRFTPVTQLTSGTLRIFYQELLLRTHRSVLVVYCKGHGLEDHVEKEYDSKEHVEAVNRNHDAICQLYDYWASHWANAFYDRTQGPAIEAVDQIIKWSRQ